MKFLYQTFTDYNLEEFTRFNMIVPPGSANTAQKILAVCYILMIFPVSCGSSRIPVPPGIYLSACGILPFRSYLCAFPSASAAGFTTRIPSCRNGIPSCVSMKITFRRPATISLLMFLTAALPIWGGNQNPFLSHDGGQSGHDHHQKELLRRADPVSA